MGLEQIEDYHQILDNVLVQKLEHNTKQIMIWNEYKNKHKKIIEGLQVYPLSLSANCMIPIGKQALMRGKLTHTNEVLVCLGADYFVKYSAAQAIALCNRRIASADEMLKNLEIERNYYEMKQILPLNHDVFGDKDKKDIFEHWNEDKVDEWKVQHRQHEKEYRQKLKILREKEKINICTEEDLLERLDQLELEEEIEDELYRLESESAKQFHSSDSENDEFYDKTDNIDEFESNMIDQIDSDVTTSEIIKDMEKLKKLQSKIANHTLESDSNITQNKILGTNSIKSEPSDLVINSDKKELRTDCLIESKNMSQSTHTKRISFIEPCATENEDNMEKETSKSQRICFMQDDVHDKDFEDENDIIRIEFSHSSHIPNTINNNIIKCRDKEIKNPGDIYEVFNAPKSILKRSPNDMIPNQAAFFSYKENCAESEDENNHVRCSIYNSVVKEKVQDRKVSINIENNTSNITDKNQTKKIVSRFKLLKAKRNDI